MEGFRTGWPSYLPDRVRRRRRAHRSTGTSKFSLTTVGIDAQIAKPITLADSAVLTPYVGYQRLYIFGDSSTVDLTPNTNPLKACGSAAGRPGRHTPSNGGNRTAATPSPLPTGSTARPTRPTSTTTSSSRRSGPTGHRGIIGLSYRYEILYLAGPVPVRPDAAERRELRGSTRRASGRRRLEAWRLLLTERSRMRTGAVLVGPRRPGHRLPWAPLEGVGRATDVPVTYSPVRAVVSQPPVAPDYATRLARIGPDSFVSWGRRRSATRRRCT